jgi:hypothetical protein
MALGSTMLAVPVVEPMLERMGFGGAKCVNRSFI